MPTKPGQLSKVAQQRVRNQRFYLSKLLKQGKLAKAQAYAAACGLVLDGGAGVQHVLDSAEADATPPLSKSFSKKDSAPEPAPASVTQTTPGPEAAPAKPAKVYVSGAKHGPSPDRFPGTLQELPPPPLVISRKSAEVHRLAVMWQAFALRLKRQGANSVMGWEEFALLQEELGFAAKVEQIVAEVTNSGVASMEPIVGELDPVGTVKGKIVKVPANRAMRLVEIHGTVGNLTRDIAEVVCWVPLSCKLPVGVEVFLCPNEDERGGYRLIGQYGRRGGRIR